MVIPGQQGDNPNKTLLFDETKAIKSTGAILDQDTFTVVDNLKGAARIDHVINGKTTISIPCMIPEYPEEALREALVNAIGAQVKLYW